MTTAAASFFEDSYQATKARYDILLVQRLRLAAPLDQVASYALADGKRMRPMFVEAVGAAIGARPQTVADIAIAIEYLHTAAILLDDLPCMDDSAQRRGVAASHVRFSQQEAILASVALLSRSYEVLLATPSGAGTNSEMARLACETVAGAMAGGQAQELRGTGATSSEAIRNIHERKTAALFHLAAKLTTLAAGSPPSVAEAIGRYAMLFGRAFQIADDMEDQAGPSADRANLPLLVGVGQAHAEARSLLSSAIESVAALDAGGALIACVSWLQQQLNSTLAT